MNCKEFEKEIPVFIERKMDFPAMKAFQEHIKLCEKCREELSIGILVADGLQHLEEGDSFDLQREFEDRLEEASRKLQHNEYFLKLGFWTEVLAVGVLAGVLVWLLI